MGIRGWGSRSLVGGMVRGGLPRGMGAARGVRKGREGGYVRTLALGGLRGTVAGLERERDRLPEREGDRWPCILAWAAWVG